MSPLAASGSACCWSGQHFRLMLRIRFTALSQAGVCSWRRWEGAERAGAALGWALKPQLQRSCTAPLWHRAVTAPTAGRGGKSCPALLKIFFTGEWRGENYSFNPRQFPPICQHMVGVIIIWLKYKASLRLFFCFNSLTILLWNLGEILWILLSFSIVPW